ncbi:MAG: glucoamylase family protein [Bacteroidota bacterium]
MRRGIYVLLIIIIWAQGCKVDSPNSFELSPQDEALLTLIQEQTFNYFWEGAEPHSGMARERIHLDGEYPDNDQDIVTTGGTGFGLMAMLVGIERGFITREEGRERITQIVSFLENAPRFHGVWSHWLNGATGEVKPFSPKDNGGDLVETAFLAQGILCARQYFRSGNQEEQFLAQRLNQLWLSIDWNFYRGEEVENVLFWHWSPEYEWEMNFRIRGYNECLIAYILAASSPTYGVDPEVYHQGWAMQGQILASDSLAPLQLIHQGNPPQGGPLFWAHYSYLALNPKGLQDQYADYWELNRTHTLLNYQHCVDNPQNYPGYGSNCWGLTASYSINFYEAHSPSKDVGVISPTAALSSFPYTPKESMAAAKYFYNDLQSKIWGKYGFYDAFSVKHDWYPQRYLAIDQGPIVIMIENYRTGLLWDLFLSNEEIQNGLTRLGFSYGS